MINNQQNKRLANHSPLEPFVGELKKVQFELSGPYPDAQNGTLYAEVSIDAKIIGSTHHMTSRYHVSQLYDQHNPNTPFKLRPAEIDDELDDGYTSIEDICPSYHESYDVRLAINSYLTTLLQENSETLTQLLGRVSRSY